MLKAEHKKWARLLYDLYIHRLLKRNFNSFYLVNDFPSIPKDSGLIITPNHFSWWDGFFIDFVSGKYLNRKIHLLMLEEQLKRFWFFRKVGAYSIEPKNPSGIAATLLYTREVISNPENFAVIYPQGELEPYDKRPPKIKDGLKTSIKNSSQKIFVLPIAFKIQYGNQKKPDILVRVGSLLSSSAILEDFSSFKKEFERNLNMLDSFNSEDKKVNLFQL